ncbi:MAG: pentapeptide repeat-containing protein [Potamolinea sp.]
MIAPGELLQNANLAGTQLNGVDLSEANLQGANLTWLAQTWITQSLLAQLCQMEQLTNKLCQSSDLQKRVRLLRKYFLYPLKSVFKAQNLL